ncbi:hypothetical protein FOZ63_018404, partial [Perkinsus olseni]
QFEMDIAYLSRPKLPEHLTKDQSPSTDTAPVPEIALQGIKRGAQTGLNLAARPNKRRHLDLDTAAATTTGAASSSSTPRPESIEKCRYGDEDRYITEELAQRDVQGDGQPW